jgi:hypothetical protein
MKVLLTLTTAGADTGPFNLYSNADAYITPFVSGISRATLVAGYTTTAVPDTATTILARSIGTCPRDLYLVISGTPTTTTTTTTSSTTSTTTSTSTTISPTTYYYYNILRYDCNLECEPGTTATGRATNALDIGYFYNPGGGFVYEILNATTGDYYNVDLYGAPSRATCSEACMAV